MVAEVPQVEGVMEPGKTFHFLLPWPCHYVIPVSAQEFCLTSF